MKIETIIDNYFEGQTSCKEERELRRFFTSGQVPEHLEVYRPLFACLDREAQLHAQRRATKSVKRRRLYYFAGSIAAALLLLTALTGIIKYHASAALPANYVIIDGKRYTDANLIREKALDAFREVQTRPEELYDLSDIE
jgi:hypothetical protein